MRHRLPFGHGLDTWLVGARNTVLRLGSEEGAGAGKDWHFWDGLSTEVDYVAQRRGEMRERVGAKEVDMEATTESLATQFEQANDEFIAAVEGFSAAEWVTHCPSEKCSVGVVAHHVAVGHSEIAELIKAAVAGQPPPLTMEMVDQANAQHAAEHAQCTKAETLALLHANGLAAAGVVHGLRDDQLGAAATFGTAGSLIEHILIGHPREHLQTIRAVLGQ